MKCKACGRFFRLKKENKYIVKRENSFPFLTAGYFDAFDCPKCGCQNVICRREDIVDEKSLTWKKSEEQSAERCVCCDEIIPEGQQTCYRCEKEAENDDNKHK